MPSILRTAFSVAALASFALAQLSLTSINFPTANSTMAAGDTITVEIGLQEYISSINNFVLVIGFQNNDVGGCYPASGELGSSILYDGPFTLSPYRYSYTYYNYYEDFNVTIPSGSPTGPGCLTVMNSYGVGGENVPGTEYLQLNVTIV